MKKTKLKKWLIALVAVVLAAAIGVGIWAIAVNRNKEPIYVYDFNIVGMTEYWGDNQESYGPVSTDRIQTVFVSDTQEITEILVQAGQQVKKGDVLMHYDTTLSDIKLDRKRLEVEKAKLKVEEAQERLRELKAMKPMVIPEIDDDEEVDLGPALEGRYELSEQVGYDGSASNKAIICWLNSSTSISNGLLEEIRQQCLQYQQFNRDNPPETEEEEETPEGEGTPDENPGEDSEDSPQPVEVNRFYVVFKVTQGNQALASKTTWQGLAVSRVEDGFTLQFFDANGIPDHHAQQYAVEVETPEVDYGSGYTAYQLSQMRAEQEQKIQDLEKDLYLVESEYAIMQKEMGDGNVYAEIDGTVVSLLTVEEAKQTAQPVLKLSDGGGFYVEGFVNELEREQLVLGQEVTINDWNTGMTYSGQVVTIGDFPTNRGYYNGLGNPNTSYYPFQVFVDGSADLQAGRYVSIQYSTGSENGIYLQKPFLRTEQGNTYVYVRGEKGTLEKRYVTTGKSLWGSYTEVLSGITAEDQIAFPYGKNVKEGAPTQEGDYSTLNG